MLGLNGGLIGVRRTPDVLVAPGLWTPNEQVIQRRAALWPSTDDPFFSNVSLLLHGDGANGSTTITDSSPSPKTVTAVGDAQISTSQSKFGGASIAFDGTGDYLSVTLSALGANDFTIEAWIRLASFRDYRVIYETRINDGDAAGFVWGVDASGRLYVFTASAFRITTGTLSANTWHHVALTRASGTWRIFVDGTLQTGTYTSSANLSRTGVRIGMDWASLHPASGHFDEVRITNGVARYTANFTPPTAPFPDS